MIKSKILNICRVNYLVKINGTIRKEKYSRVQTKNTFIRGRFSALSFRTWYLIFLLNSLLCRFSRYLMTRASLPPALGLCPSPPWIITGTCPITCSLPDCPHPKLAKSGTSPNSKLPPSPCKGKKKKIGHIYSLYILIK